MITVGISCYNIESYIGRCIESVCAQTYEDLEIIIVDDGSTDGSGKVCDAYAAKDARIRVIHQENAGPGVARNRVMEEMRGDWLMFVDGDDYVAPEMAEVMLKACLEAGTEIAVCRYFQEGTPGPSTGSGTGEVTEGTVLLSPSGDSRTVPLSPTVVFSRDELLTRYIEEDEQYPIRNAVWNKLMKRELIDTLRMPGQMCYEDILFTVKLLAAAEKAVFVDTPLYHYIIDREDSIMNRGVNIGIVTDQIPAYHAREEFLRSIGREDLALTDSYITCKKLLELYEETVWPYRGRKRVLQGEQKKELRQGIAETLREYGKKLEEIFSVRIANPHEKWKMRLFLKGEVWFRLFTMVNDGVIRPARGL